MADIEKELDGEELLEAEDGKVGFLPDYIYTLEDEEGNEVAFELLDVMEFEGEKYFALTPYAESAEELLESDGEVVILKSQFDGDEELMVTIDDEEEYERVGNIFIEKLQSMYDFDDEE